MPNGFWDRILWVDLNTGVVEVRSLGEKAWRSYIGGSGLATRIFADLGGEASDPLGPDNPLIFMTGPLTGTQTPMAGRHQVVTKSPLTGIFGEADAGGAFGHTLKRAGYDGIVFLGQSAEPVYLLINEERAELRPAEDLWGLDVYETDERLRASLGSAYVTAAIGPAGEKLVRLAGIICDGRHARANARCGVGAVMGSKKLKAIAVNGNKRCPVSREDELRESVAKGARYLAANTKMMRAYGTAGGLQAMEALGDVPIQNWRMGLWNEGTAKLSGQRMAETILTGRYYCRGCVIGCGREVEIKEGKYAGVKGAGPEYESIATLGTLCLVDDLEAVAAANEFCNRYGLDTISTGSAIAFAMELYEHGLLTTQDTGGLELNWGNADALVELVRQIGEKRGLGELLGRGVRAAAEEIGGLALEFAVHTKGLEFPAHDPRAYNSVGLGYATSNRGACHLQGFTHQFEKAVTMPEIGFPEIQDRFGLERKGELVARAQDLMCLMDSLKLCKFSLGGGLKVTHMVEWLNLVTGWSMSIEEFLLAGERIFNLKRVLNVKCGVSRKDDTLPPRILTLKRAEGGAATNLPPLNQLLSEYYAVRGWDEFGRPQSETLQRLGLA